MNILKKLVKGGLDMQRMTDTIHKKIRDVNNFILNLD